MLKQQDMPVATEHISSHPFPVLVVEDSAVIQRQLEIVLGREGFDIDTTGDGNHALELMNRRFYPIVITDWMMPGMDGPTLCRAIRKKQTPGYVFIILLTSRDSREDIVQGLKSGADDYVNKPFDVSELIARINAGERILELEHSLKRANERIRKLSITDPLTKCYNRSYLAERMPQALKTAARYGQCLSIMLFDVDHFKIHNDTLGHLAGDELLEEFARFVKTLIRIDVDWLVRYGGDEFLLVMLNTPVSGAADLAKRLCTGISHKSFTVLEKKIRITASFGVTGIDMSNGAFRVTGDALIGSADRYLYEAKKAGRNTVKIGSYSGEQVAAYLRAGPS